MSTSSAVLQRARALPATSLRSVQGLARLDDGELGTWLLSSTPTNQARTRALLQQVSDRAQRFGRALSDAGTRSASPSGGERGGTAPSAVIERDDGLDRPEPLLARYLHRTSTVELFVDTVQLCEDLIDQLDWREWFPPGCVREAALAH